MCARSGVRTNGRTQVLIIRIIAVAASGIKTGAIGNSGSVHDIRLSVYLAIFKTKMQANNNFFMLKGRELNIVGKKTELSPYQSKNASVMLLFSQK